MSWVLFRCFELRDKRSHRTPNHPAHRLQLNTSLSESLGRPNAVQEMGFLSWFFLLQKDINTIHSIRLDESESETIYFGQPNMLSSSLFLLENFGPSMSSIPWGASFLTAKSSSKNLQNYLHLDFRKKSVIKLVICITCFLSLGWQQFCIFEEFNKLCVHRHTLKLDVSRHLPALTQVAWTVAGLSLWLLWKNIFGNWKVLGFFGLFLPQKSSDRLMGRFLQVVRVAKVHAHWISFLRSLQWLF